MATPLLETKLYRPAIAAGAACRVRGWASA